MTLVWMLRNYPIRLHTHSRHAYNVLHRSDHTHMQAGNVLRRYAPHMQCVRIHHICCASTYIHTRDEQRRKRSERRQTWVGRTAASRSERRCSKELRILTMLSAIVCPRLKLSRRKRERSNTTSSCAIPPQLTHTQERQEQEDKDRTRELRRRARVRSCSGARREEDVQSSSLRHVLQRHVLRRRRLFVYLLVYLGPSLSSVIRNFARKNA
jgi:hypothetical protein